MPGVIQYLMVRPDIKRAEDLKGKTIGVTTFGSLGDFLVRHLARLRGLNPDKDFALRQIGADPERFISLQTRKNSSRDAFPSDFYSGAARRIPHPLGFFQRRRISLE